MVLPRIMPVEDVFRVHFPKEVLEDVLRTVVATYPATLKLLQDTFPDVEAIDLRPHWQRALVDRDLRGVAEKHARLGISHDTPTNITGGARHLELYSGNAVMTAHYIPWKEGTVRRAHHRIKLCDPAQGELFEQAAIPIETRLYAHLLHGCDGIKARERVNRKVPDFVYIRFPLPDMSAYAAPLIDLIKDFPHVLGRKQSTPVHEVPDLATPILPHRPAAGNE